MLTLDELMLTLPNSVVVGGSVRDFILSHKTVADAIDEINNSTSIEKLFDGVDIHDIDIATSMTPSEILAKFPTDSFASGEAFGTVSVRVIGKDFCEITTFRRDISNGRKPDVEFAKTFIEDSKRRDIRINGLGIGFDENGKCKLFDHVQGLKDIDEGIICAIGNPIERICIEDQLRSLRTCRFALKFDFSIELNTAKALKMVDLHDVSGNRIRDELEKMFEINSVKAIKILDEHGLLKIILPELCKLKETRHNPIHHPESSTPFGHTLSAMSKFNNPNFIKLIKELKEKFNVKMEFDKLIWISKFCVMSHDLGKDVEIEPMKFFGHAKRGVPITENILDRLNVSKEFKSAVLFSVENHMKMHVLDEMKTSKQRKLFTNPNFIFLLITSICDASARLEGDEIIDIDSIMEIINKKENVGRELPKLITGHDVLALGFKGKEIGDIMKEIEIAQVENRITTRDEALDFISKF